MDMNSPRTRGGIIIFPTSMEVGIKNIFPIGNINYYCQKKEYRFRLSRECSVLSIPLFGHTEL